jgi:hypothetical protein
MDCPNFGEYRVKTMALSSRRFLEAGKKITKVQRPKNEWKKTVKFVLY